MSEVTAPIPLPEWIERARISISEEDYLECAIAVAYELANCLLLCSLDNGNSNGNGNSNSIEPNNACNSISNSNVQQQQRQQQQQQQSQNHTSFNGSLTPLGELLAIEEFDEFLNGSDQLNIYGNDEGEGGSGIGAEEKKGDGSNSGSINGSTSGDNGIPSSSLMGPVDVSDGGVDLPSSCSSSSSSSMGPVRIEDLVPENIMVSMVSEMSFVPAEVNILQPSKCSTTDDNVNNNNNNNNNNINNSSGHYPQQDELCFALGNILVQIFSQATPLSNFPTNILSSSSSATRMDVTNERSNEDSFIDLLLGEVSTGELAAGESTNDLVSAPSLKRSATNSRSTSFTSSFNSSNSTLDNNNNKNATVSMKANASLHEKGLPLSICQLVTNLLEAESGSTSLYRSDKAIVSLAEAHYDLMQMKLHPERFLKDDTDPRVALEKTGLFVMDANELYGREGEIEVLMDAASRIEGHVSSSGELPAITTTTMADERATAADINGGMSSPPLEDGGTSARSSSAEDIGGSTHSLDDDVVMDSAPTTPPFSATNANDATANNNEGFSCEAVFLSGHSGSGKSSITKHIISHCNANHWFVLTCKFDRQVAPLSALLQSFDAFFGRLVVPTATQQQQQRQPGIIQREPWVQEAFERISSTIVSLIDGESYCQLCELLPNLGEFFPLPFAGAVGANNKRRSSFTTNITNFTEQTTTTNTATAGEAVEGPEGGSNDPLSSFLQRSSSPGGVGSGNNRLLYLFHVIFKLVRSGGRPVIIVVDDLQWSDAFTMDILGDFAQTDGSSSTATASHTASSSSSSGAQESLHNGGLLLVGTFRDNEVDADGFVMNQITCMDLSSTYNQSITVKRLFVGELPEFEINKMLSFKFCLPMRHTAGLARLVFHKTRGNPMYIVEFLRSIIKRNMMTFSVKSRRWTWDDDSIDFHMISEGVVELLTRKLQQLPPDVIQALKVISCFGQINVSMIRLLDLGQFVPDMSESLELALKEGILEKAGPLYAFSHDMLQESTYALIPTEERGLLHKQIGKSLVQDPDILNNNELCTLAADQINICKDTDGILDPSEKALFVRVNLRAGKNSIAASSYEQARGYFEAGISLLATNPWDKQYSLCLELYEMSVIVSFIGGNVETVSSRLSDILSHARSFDDALNSRSLRAKFLASQAQYAEAASELLDVLSNLGEEFPKDVGLSHVRSEVKATQLMLKDITKEQILNLPTIQDAKELKKMKSMGILIALANFSSPMLVPLLCCRMMKMTFKFGSCEDTISGLAFMSHALLHYSDDVMLASRVGRIAEQLIVGNIHEHSLRARLTQMTGSVKVMVEPFQAAVEHCRKGYNSAKIVGDVDNAVLCGMIYCMAHFFIIPDLIGLQKYMVNFFQQMAKHKRIGVLRSAMSYFCAVTSLIGNKKSCKIDSRIKMKTNEELYHIAEQTQSAYLKHHVLTNQMYIHCFFREYLIVANLGEDYRKMHTGTNVGTKRTLDFIKVFVEGISALCLARDTKQEKWRKIGEDAVRTMKQLVENSAWNFENKLCLLQAELYYLNHRHSMAELSYQASIVSAHEHKFFHEEALACELYGIYLIENKKLSKGMKQLKQALNKYKAWGATKKADSVKDFVYVVKKPAKLWNK